MSSTARPLFLLDCILRPPCSEFFIHASTQTTRIESALGHLAYIQDYQLIVQLVEYWHGVGHPSPLARLFAVQALMELCQMDRAWARLRELIESHPNWPDAHRTAAELFISRGWPKQARRPLQQAQLLEPDHPELIRLEALLRQQNLVGTEPPDNDALRTLMDKAKRLLRTGSKVKGAALLNQLQSRHPEDPSVKQLVWAHSGDFMLHDHSLWTHYAEKEHTYNATVSLNPPPTRHEPNNTSQIESDSAYNNRHINGLFLHSSDIDTEEIHPVDDATDSVELANLADLQRTSGVDFVRIGETIDVDTQIRRVFSKNTEPSNPSQHIHSNLPDQIEGFDLHAFRREMGMPQRIRIRL